MNEITSLIIYADISDRREQGHRRILTRHKFSPSKLHAPDRIMETKRTR